MHRFQLIAVFALLLAACGTDDPSDKTNSCTADVDCEAGFHCGDDDKCVQECDPAADDPGCATGQMCSDKGRCVSSGECVVDDDCDSPPSDATCDGDSVVAYNQIGTCNTGGATTVCEYTETRTTCESGCAAGACIPDSCETLTCSTPPSAVCDADGTTLIEFAEPGACSEGVCQYSEVPTSCALGCAGGACQQGTCDSVTCNQPPADECDGTTAMRFAQTGQCEEFNGRAVCDYSPVFEDCAYVKAECANAQCGQGITEVGGVVITEIMPNPSASFNDLGEWFEMVNTSGQDIDLNAGWKLRSKGSGSNIEEHVFENAPIFEAGGNFVLVYSDSAPFSYNYNYDDVRLANNTDWIELVNANDEVVDYVYYEGGSILSGHSRKLDPSAAMDVTSNNDFANWCPSLDEVYESDAIAANYGSPGGDNGPCAADPCAGYSCVQPDDYCNTRTNTAVNYLAQSVSCEATRFNNPFCDYDTSETKCTDGTELCAFGTCETIPSNLPTPGDLIITEAMPNPESFDTDREWIEVYNTTGAPLAMFSMIFEDNELDTSNNEYQFLDINLEVPANGYLALIRNTDPAENGGVTNAALYSGAHLKNDPDPADAKTPAEGMKLVLTLMDGTVIDEAYYDNPEDESQGFPSGQSLQLSSSALDATSNDDGGNWCFADPSASYGQGGAGTPGAANAACP